MTPRASPPPIRRSFQRKLAAYGAVVIGIAVIVLMPAPLRLPIVALCVVAAIIVAIATVVRAAGARGPDSL